MSTDASTTPPAHDEPVSADDSSSALLAAIYEMQDAEALFRARLRKKLSIGSSELGTLQYLSRLESRGIEARPTDIAANLGVTTSAASIIVNRLVARGYVLRTHHPTDGRGQYLHLTAAAHEAVTAASGRGELGGLTRATHLSERESRRIVTLLASVTTGFTDGASTPS